MQLGSAKCFLMGFVGAILGLLLSMFVGAQYADYMAAAQTDAWLNEVGPTVATVNSNIEKMHGVSGAGTGVATPNFSGKPPPPALALVTADGAILLQGGYRGQAVVLVPSWTGGKVAWRCIGGSQHDTLPCKHWQPR
jgi:hypothetical protein